MYATKASFMEVLTETLCFFSHVSKALLSSIASHFGSTICCVKDSLSTPSNIKNQSNESKKSHKFEKSKRWSHDAVNFGQ